MGKLLLRLLLGLLKLIVQLVLLAVTGSWVKLERPTPEQQQAEPKRRKGSKRAKRPKRAPSPARPRPAPLLEGEEPLGGELAWIGGEQAVGDRMPRAPRQRRVRMSAPPPVGHDARSLRRALANPRTVREAIVLGAALGRRPARR